MRDASDDAHFTVFVYPTVKTSLERLGWRLHGPAYLSIPAVGVSIGSSAISFWEAGTPTPTLILKASDILSATVGRVSDGYRDHPAVQLTLHTTSRDDELKLNLRNARHRNISPLDWVK